MKRYCIRTNRRDVGGLPVEFPYHDEDPRGAWVRFEDVRAALAPLAALASQLDEDHVAIAGRASPIGAEIRACLAAVFATKETP